MKNKKRYIINISLIITLCVMVGLGVKAIEVKKVMTELDHQIVEAELELKKEKETLEKLKKEKEEINSPAYIEKVAREKLGMVKADDVLIKEKQGGN